MLKSAAPVYRMGYHKWNGNVLNDPKKNRIAWIAILASQMNQTRHQQRSEENVKIDRLPPDRWKEFKKLRLESLRNDPRAFLSSYEEEADFDENVWRNRSRDVVFALVADRPVGMITFLRRNRKKNDHVADIFGVYVGKGYRGKGIGDKLVRKAIESLKKNKGVSKIVLSVMAEQEPAVNLYLKYGFKVVGILEDELRIDGNFYDELVMEKLMR